MQINEKKCSEHFSKLKKHLNFIRHAGAVKVNKPRQFWFSLVYPCYPATTYQALHSAMGLIPFYLCYNSSCISFMAPSLQKLSKIMQIQFCLIGNPGALAHSCILELKDEPETKLMWILWLRSDLVTYRIFSCTVPSLILGFGDTVFCEPTKPLSDRYSSTIALYPT